MNHRAKQTLDYETSLELAQIPIAARTQAMKGAALFFDRGWPSNHFTVGMASRAGMGLIPPVYDGPGSEERYFESTMQPLPASRSGSPSRRILQEMIPTKVAVPSR
jgi:hypothetical protein